MPIQQGQSATQKTKMGGECYDLVCWSSVLELHQFLNGISLCSHLKEVSSQILLGKKKENLKCSDILSKGAYRLQPRYT